MIEWKGELNQRCVSHTEKTEELRTTIYGVEPNPGVKGNVDKLMESRKFWIRIFGVTLASFFISIGAWVVSLFKSH